MITEQAAYDSIVWSADVADSDTMLYILEQAPKLKHVKVDRLFVERHGPGIFDNLAELDIKAFYDAKYIEIPEKLEALAKAGCGFHPWMLNCMAGALSNGEIEAPKLDEIDGLKRFADVCLKAGVRPCAVTVLTSKKKDVVEDEFNGRSSVEQVLFYVEELLECGFTDVVCSAEEVAYIRAESRFDELDLNTPGIRRPGSSSDDQARKKSPVGALQAGSDRLVIGRDITRGDNPAQNLKDIVTEIRAA
jgi:orotidine-5'-phosphate decarboxylase